MEVADWLNASSGAITGMAAIITAAATVTLAVITWRYVRLTKDYVRLTNRLLKATTNTPQMAIYLDDTDYQVYAALCVENVGTGPAHDIRFNTNLSLCLYGPDHPHKLTLRDVGFIRDGINYLHPGRKRKCILQLTGRLNELKATPLKISTTYKDSEREKYQDCFYLDFGELINSSHDRSPLHDIHSTLRNIDDNLRRLRS